MTMHPEFRQQWKRAGYSEVMGSAEVLPPPPREFIRVYHITSAEYGISNIGLRRLKVSRFTDLNDPFELLALNVRDKPARKRLAEFKTTYDSKTGLLCFSGNWTNPVLWSHYGNRHRGMCLGFDLKRGRQERVDYQDKRLRAQFGDDSGGPLNISDDLLKKLLCTKYAHWSYEEELRVFVSLADSNVRKEGNLHFYPFGDDLILKEVVLGPECSVPLEGVRRLVDASYMDVTTIKARLAVKSFAVVPLEKTVP